MTITNIFSRSWPGTSVIEVSIVKDDSPDLPIYKSKYFMFLSLIPGKKNADGSRGYDRDNRITLKVEPERLSSLAKSIRLYANGKQYKYAIFTQSNNVTKQCFAGTYLPQGKTDADRLVSIGFKLGQNQPVGISISVPEALSLADEFEWITSKCMELEYDFKRNYVPDKKPIPKGQVDNGQVPPPPFSNDALGSSPFDDGPFQ